MKELKITTSGGFPTYDYATIRTAILGIIGDKFFCCDYTDNIQGWTMIFREKEPKKPRLDPDTVELLLSIRPQLPTKSSALEHMAKFLYKNGIREYSTPSGTNWEYID